MSDNKTPSKIGGSKESNSAVPQLPITSSDDKSVIKYLEEKQTNFVFLFGKSGTGKSAIVASMLHYLSSNPDYLVEVLRSDENPEGTRYVLSLRDDLRNQKFPARTDINKKPFNLDINFFKRNKNGEREEGIPLTFLEMSGEKLSKVQVPKSGMSEEDRKNAHEKLPNDVDVYFKADGLSMLFIMVTTPADARADDSLMTEFLDYISSKDKKYRDAYIFLAITQYDRYQDKTNGLSIQQFIRQSMPNSYSRFHSKKNQFGYYTVGDVVTLNEGQDNIELYIKSIDSKSPERLFSWIYETITKKELFPVSFWQRLMGRLKF